LLLEGLPVDPDRNSPRFSATDAMLITYGDTLNAPGTAPLQVLGRFLESRLQGVFPLLHILPFFPSSSDDGFAVTDYYAVDPLLGDWADIEALGRSHRLVVDFVLNHISAQSAWVLRYLAEEGRFKALALEADPQADFSRVMRPRIHPLLTPLVKGSGNGVHVWTTFSADQIDINYRSIDILLEMVAVLLFYLQSGASVIRLDAVAYLFKEIGTACIHLPATHAMVRLLRQILERAAPRAMLLTETNVPHEENARYFGNGHDAAQLAYNFTLAPLLLHALLTGEGRTLSNWARTLTPLSRETAWVNFSASHDGIGLRPLEGLLPPEAVARLVAHGLANGGQVSYKTNPDGSQSPYELNVTYIDALKGPGRDPWHVPRVLASQAVEFALPGIPATYIHTLLGSRNWSAGVARTGRARSINREKLQVSKVMAQLADPASFRSRIFSPYLHMISIRQAQPAFHPHAEFEVLDLDPRIFALKRRAYGQQIIALTNLSAQPVALDLSADVGGGPFEELLSRSVQAPGAMRLAPYQVAWLSAPIRKYDDIRPPIHPG
jgi:sucrose phosphorylase